MLFPLSHKASELLTCANQKYADFCFTLFNTLFETDIGRGDVTTELISDSERTQTGTVVTHQSGLVAGIEEVLFFFKRKMPSLEFIIYKNDGDKVSKGEVILKVSGSLKNLLGAERLLLNVLQRMSGIAYNANKLVEKVGNTVLVTPTRKTLWGLIDKKACLIGGAGTHRLTLSDAILVKDNHLVAIKHNFVHLLNQLQKLPDLDFNSLRFVEVEVSNLMEFVQLLDAIKTEHYHRSEIIVMLDNFTIDDISKAQTLRLKNKLPCRIILEASGGITLDNVQMYSDTGVDLISLGALTHSVRAFDCSFELSFTSLDS